MTPANAKNKRGRGAGQPLTPQSVSHDSQKAQQAKWMAVNDCDADGNPLAKMEAHAISEGVAVDPLAGRLVCAHLYLDTEPPPRDSVIDGLIDRGDKMMVVGKSKAKKTWMLLQMAACISRGQQFIGFEVPKRRKVLFVNPEVRPHHMHRRTRMYAFAAGCSKLTNLYFLHTRGTGAGWPDIREAALQIGAEVVCIDSIYKFMPDDENATDAWKDTCLQMDVLCESTGAMLAYTHHDTKGSTAEKTIVDRGSGSGVAGRDYDASMAISPHGEEDDAVVVEFICRNYATPDKKPLMWDHGAFVESPDIGAVIQTKKSRMQQLTRTPPLSTYYGALQDAVKDGLIPRGILEERIKSSTGLGNGRILTLISNAVHDGHIAKTGRLKERDGRVLYGLPDEVASLLNRTNQEKTAPEEA